MEQENAGDNVRRGAWKKMGFNTGDGGNKKRFNIGLLSWLAVGVVVLLWLATGIYKEFRKLFLPG